MFRVFVTDEFKEDFNKLDFSNRKRVSKIMKQLKERGDKVGKPLGRRYFREKKFGGKRLYFLVYKQLMVVLAVGISNKKAQQDTINEIISEIKNYDGFVIKKLEEEV